MQVAGDLDGYHDGEAEAFNDSGEVPGTALVIDGVRYAWDAFVGRNGVATDLGTLQKGATLNVANAIDNRGVIVGVATFDDGVVAYHAFVYTGEQVHDLNSLIARDSGWILTKPTAINDAGGIVGTGLLNGSSATFC